MLTSINDLSEVAILGGPAHALCINVTLVYGLGLDVCHTSAFRLLTFK